VRLPGRKQFDNELRSARLVVFHGCVLLVSALLAWVLWTGVGNENTRAKFRYSLNVAAPLGAAMDHSHGCEAARELIRQHLISCCSVATRDLMLDAEL